MEYRSGVTGGPHPGVDIFPDLSPRAKPYCGVKCSQGWHFPATDCGAWGDGTQSPHSKRRALVTKAALPVGVEELLAGRPQRPVAELS